MASQPSVPAAPPTVQELKGQRARLQRSLDAQLQALEPARPAGSSPLGGALRTQAISFGTGGAAQPKPSLSTKFYESQISSLDKQIAGLEGATGGSQATGQAAGRSPSAIQVERQQRAAWRARDRLGAISTGAAGGLSETAASSRRTATSGVVATGREPAGGSPRPGEIRRRRRGARSTLGFA